jgi:flagella basal body P-ring formation protein FlgA
MIARLVTPLSLCLLLTCVLPQPATADALLHTRVVVESDSVTLGDLFDNAGERANQVVLHAPAPGSRVTLDSDWLQHVALVNGLSWHPRGLFEDAVVERAGETIGNEQILAALQDALRRQGAPEDCAIETDGHPPHLVVAAGLGATIEIRDLFYDATARRFTASLVVASGAGGGRDLTRLALSGRVFATVLVPVLSHPMGRGEVVRTRDLTWQKLRPEQLRPMVLTDADQLVGQVARQTLRAGMPLTEGDLQKPLAVNRGAMVTMVLSYGGMALTAQGRALDQGSLGDVIRVTNEHSNLTVEGTIIGPNQLRVSLNGTIAFAN